MTPKTLVGDCDCCPDSVNVELFILNNMQMCAGCRDKSITASQFITESRAVDSSIQLEKDIYNAGTVSAIELRAAILNNPSIPDSDKEHSFTKECYVRFLQFKEVISGLRKQMKEAENNLMVWQTEGQVSAGKLKAELRAKYKEFDSNYQVAPITKKQKSTTPVKSTSQAMSISAAAKKYDIDPKAVRAIMVDRPNMTAEMAAKYMAELMGK